MLLGAALGAFPAVLSCFVALETVAGRPRCLFPGNDCVGGGADSGGGEVFGRFAGIVSVVI